MIEEDNRTAIGFIAAKSLHRKGKSDILSYQMIPSVTEPLRRGAEFLC